MIPEIAEYITAIYAAIKLENNLLREISWDSIDIQSPHRHLNQEEEYQPMSDPTSQSDTLVVNIKAKEHFMDGFIERIITLTIDEPTWV